ncbi:MAG: NAD-dependent epimerase/dehydratase family protein, partial [Clostridia bacterium]
MKNYVITGATGHLGNTLVNQILNTSADNIKLLVLPNEDVSIYNSARVTIVYGNILDKAFLEREISKDNIVIHMAGIVDISAGNKDLLYKVNIEGTRNIASVCYEKQVDKFVYTSSVHVIPCGGAEKVLSEPTDFNADNVVGDYAKSK